MAYLVFISEECKEEAAKHGLKDRLFKLKDKIEKEQYIGQLDRFGSSSFYVKKKFYNYQARLVAKIVSVPFGEENHSVVVFLGLLIRGDKPYIDFHNNPEEFGQKFFRGSCPEPSELKQYLKEEFKQNPLPKKPDAEAVYLDYLNLPHVKTDEEKNELIYESRTWVSTVTDSSKGFINILPELCSCLNKIFTERLEKEKETDLFFTDSSHGIEIHYSCLKDGGIFLIDLKKNEGLFKEPCYVAEKIKDGKDIVDSYVYKSYPWYMLGDEPAWRELEKEAKNNYVLSFEESEVYKSALHERKYPLFINGRAGSGKSTILQYIFTEYCFNAILMEEKITLPAYFTYSKKLKESAQDFVKGLLKNNSKFTYLPQIQRTKLQNSLELPLCVFQWTDYLIDLIQEPEVKNKFKDPSLHVDYSKFKNLWAKKKGQNPEDQRYGVDLAWHIIRTYIKGLDPDGETTVEDYVLIPKKQRIVDEEEYEYVYQRVWGWYKDLCEQHNFWDDQDLARYVLENNLVRPTFPGIFCDEAQDFTQLEIDIIIRLSYFFDKKMVRGMEYNIPFVFAGDELQTLNPTGFRWDSLKAWLSEKFISEISSGGDERKGIDDSQFKTFKINYRSPKSIVNFCNSIQLLRSSAFDIPNIKPQDTWSDREDMSVYYFHSGNAKFWDNIPTQENIVFLIPCNEGEEDEWRKKDEMLRDKSNYLVFSPAAVKGLEYHWVVLYRFGEWAPASAVSLSAGLKNKGANNLEAEYYFNKTYVAASRATKRLIIVDTEKDKFWSFCSSKRYAELLQSVREGGNRNGWEERFLTPFMDGDIDALNPDKSSHPEETAEKIKNLGMSEGSPYHMRQAASAYRNIGKEKEAKFCEAYSFVYDGKYKEAGENFQASGHIDEAIEYLWLSQNTACFSRINELISQAKADDWRLVGAFSKALIEKNEIDALRVALDEFTKRSLLPKQIGSYESHCKALGKNIERVIDKLDGSNQHSILNAPLIEKTLKKIQELKLPLDQKYQETLIISLAKIGNEEKAVELWEKLGFSKQFEGEYHSIKAGLIGFPKNLENLKYLESWGRIKEDYEAHGQSDLSQTHLEIIAEAYIKLTEYHNAAILLRLIDDGAVKKKIKAMIPEKYMPALLKQEEIISLFEKVDWSLIARELNTLILQGENAFDCFFALCLARMDILSLPDTPKENTTRAPLTRKRISEFLVKKILPYVENIPVLFMKDIGAVFEKAGNHKNALIYYEKCINHISNKDFSRDFALRWIVCKERQKEKLGEGKSFGAEQKRKELGIPSTQSLPEYPELSGWDGLRDLLSEHAQKQGKNQKGKIRIKKSTPMPSITGLRLIYKKELQRLLASDDAGSIITIVKGKVQSSEFELETLSDKAGEYTNVSGTDFCFRSSGEALSVWDKKNPDDIFIFE